MGKVCFFNLLVFLGFNKQLLINDIFYFDFEDQKIISCLYLNKLSPNNVCFICIYWFMWLIYNYIVLFILIFFVSL